MKNRYVILGALLASTIIAGSAFAWGPPRGGYDNQRSRSDMCFGHFEFMQDKLGLTDEQVKKIFKINQEYRQKCFDNRKNIDKLDELWLQHRKEIRAVLTKEQVEKMYQGRRPLPGGRR